MSCTRVVRYASTPGAFAEIRSKIPGSSLYGMIGDYIIALT